MFKRIPMYFAVIFALASIPMLGSAADNGLSSTDEQFIIKAAQAGYAEVTAGHIASSRAPSDEVKKFGDQMVLDHGNAGDELATILQEKGINPPNGPDAAHQEFISKLRTVNAVDFDTLYVEEAGINDHKAALSLFENEVVNGKDKDLKAFAVKTLPTIEHHYQMAQDLSKVLDKK